MAYLRTSPLRMSFTKKNLHILTNTFVIRYPIYRILNGNTLRDIEACFLTYHHISLSVKDAESELGPKIKCKKAGPFMNLLIVGMANYKFSRIFGPHIGARNKLLYLSYNRPING